MTVAVFSWLLVCDYVVLADCFCMCLWLQGAADGKASGSGCPAAGHTAGTVDNARSGQVQVSTRLLAAGAHRTETYHCLH